MWLISSLQYLAQSSGTVSEADILIHCSKFLKLLSVWKGI